MRQKHIFEVLGLRGIEDSSDIFCTVRLFLCLNVHSSRGGLDNNIALIHTKLIFLVCRTGGGGGGGGGGEGGLMVVNVTT